MAFEVRIALSGELLDGGVERVHHFPKLQRCEEKEEGLPGREMRMGGPPEYKRQVNQGPEYNEQVNRGNGPQAGFLG